VISDRHRCIFVHIPRCAGTSIEDVLWPGSRREEELWMGFVDQYHNRYQTGGLQHLLARQIRQEVGDERFSSYFKFTVVRNPFDRAVSQFAYMKQRPDLRSFIGMPEDASFPEYVALIRGERHVQWEPQSSFVVDLDGELLVDFIGRFEALDSDMSRVLSRLGLAPDVTPHRNASDRRAYASYYTAECQAQVEDMYREDIDRFGYAF
jgi:hypothetical protein